MKILLLFSLFVLIVNGIKGINDDFIDDTIDINKEEDVDKKEDVMDETNKKKNMQVEKMKNEKEENKSSGHKLNDKKIKMMKKEVNVKKKVCGGETETFDRMIEVLEEQVIELEEIEKRLKKKEEKLANDTSAYYEMVARTQIKIDDIKIKEKELEGKKFYALNFGFVSKHN